MSVDNGLIDILEIQYEAAKFNAFLAYIAQAVIEEIPHYLGRIKSLPEVRIENADE